MAQFHHVGVPTSMKQPKETYIEGAKVHITDPDTSPYRFEYLRFEPGTPMPEVMQKNPHVAYKVESIDQALKGEEVLVPPFDATPTIRAAFIVKDNVVVELMEMK